ncbi:MAG: endolytic transglycosylase MltG [Porticoccaceae bacterium]|nr:endolytic transglycosylase MltG [Porticoccaceae bacterium]
MLKNLKRLLRTTIVLVLLAAVGLAVLLGTAQRFLEQPVTLSKNTVEWSIQTGESLNGVNRQLYQNNIVSHPRLLSLYGRMTGQSAIQAGLYQINSDDTAKSLLERFNRGQVISFQITFPEGWSYQQWLQHLASVEQFADISELSQAQIMTAAGIRKSHPEGWLFPDTYSYISSDKAIDILARAHLKMEQVLNSAWQNRSADIPYNSAYEALIMASIIEKETGLAEERPEIAGVFVRRLNKGMRLQTDPTVIYGLGLAYRGDLKRSHLKTFSPYNTYMIKGLPPTPIAMPSAAAIEAALHPLAGTSLYFVARGDGGHYFSETLGEHQKAVRKYQINQRAKDYQSAPTRKSSKETTD